MVLFSKVTSSGKSSAPLWTWCVAAAVVLIFLGVSFYVFFRANSFEHFNPQRLECFSSPVGKDTLRVAVIGTSLTRHAFYKDEAMESFANSRGLKIRFLRFTLERGKLNDFYDLSEAVINSEADVICFEAALFGIDLGDDSATLDRYRYFLRHGGTKFLAELPFVPKRKRSEKQNENYAAEDLLLTPLPGAKSDLAAGRYRETSSRFKIRDFAEGKEFAELFSQARECGKVVIFLDLSRSQKAWDMLPSNFERKLDAVMGRYEEVSGIRYLRFPYRLPIDYFQDFAHLGPKGRKFYSAWFLTNLVSLSRGGGK